MIDPSRIGHLPAASDSHEPHVTIDVSQIPRAVELLQSMACPTEEAVAGWKECVPPCLLSLSEALVTQYLCAVVCIDFRHWVFAQEGGGTQTWTCQGYRGSHAMTTLCRLAVEQLGVHWYRTEWMAQEASVCALQHMFYDMPALEERVVVLRGVGGALMEQYGPCGFAALLDKSNKRLFTTDGTGFIERLCRLHERYRDDAYRDVPILKLSQLSALALLGVLGPTTFEDAHHLTLCADYQIPRTLRALGVLRYSDALAAKVDAMQPLEVGGSEEGEIRCATVQCGRLILEEFHRRKEEVGFMTVSSLDYLLWSAARVGRVQGLRPHHVAVTIMY